MSSILPQVIHLHTYDLSTDWVGTVSTACGLNAAENLPCVPAWAPRPGWTAPVCPLCLHAIGAPGSGRFGTTPAHPPDPTPPLDAHHTLALTSPLEHE